LTACFGQLIGCAGVRGQGKAASICVWYVIMRESTDIVLKSIADSSFQCTSYLAGIMFHLKRGKVHSSMLTVMRTQSEYKHENASGGRRDGTYCRVENCEIVPSFLRVFSPWTIRTRFGASRIFGSRHVQGDVQACPRCVENLGWHYEAEIEGRKFSRAVVPLKTGGIRREGSVHPQSLLRLHNLARSLAISVR
jgi:hypothetical protein